MAKVVVMVKNTKENNHFVDEKYDYIDITEEDYEENKKFIEQGFGEVIGIILYVLKHKKGNFYKKIIRKIDENLSFDNENYDIYAKYFITQLSEYDDGHKDDNEIFDHFKIDGIGFYKITDQYKHLIGGLGENSTLHEKCHHYETNYENKTNEKEDIAFLKKNTKKY